MNTEWQVVDQSGVIINLFWFWGSLFRMKYDESKFIIFYWVILINQHNYSMLILIIIPAKNFEPKAPSVCCKSSFDIMKMY